MTDQTPPLTPVEAYLYYLAGGEVETLGKPRTRVEQYLYWLCVNGVDATIPAHPVTRLEWYLAYLCEHWSEVITSGATIVYKSADGSQTLHVERIKDGESGTYSLDVDTYTDESTGEIYEFAGWSATIGGTVSSSITQNVYVDTVCYAVYSASGRFVPASIAVTSLPTKTVYEDGETIDYTGLEVTVYKKDGTVWTDEYVGGIVPISELTLPVTVAEYVEE